MKRLFVLMTLTAMTIGMVGCCGQRPFQRLRENRRQTAPQACPCVPAGPMMMEGGPVMMEGGPMMMEGEVITVPPDQLPGPAETTPG